MWSSEKSLYGTSASASCIWLYKTKTMLVIPKNLHFVLLQKIHIDNAWIAVVSLGNLSSLKSTKKQCRVFFIKSVFIMENHHPYWCILGGWSHTHCALDWNLGGEALNKSTVSGAVRNSLFLLLTDFGYYGALKPGIFTMLVRFLLGN